MDLEKNVIACHPILSIFYLKTFGYHIFSIVAMIFFPQKSKKIS